MPVKRERERERETAYKDRDSRDSNVATPPSPI